MRSTFAQPDDLGIRAEGLAKRFGDVQALAGLDLAVPAGSILGLLGPNGAGKTTAVNILTTLLAADAGAAWVAGASVTADPAEVRRRIGLSGQYAAVDEHLTGFENLVLVGRLSRLKTRHARTRARDLLERFSLEEAADRPVGTYSGGMRRRLDLAGALIVEPSVLFLDEPTTGLDPRSRAELWVVIEELVERGRTVLLTTQYMEEADHLADDIVVIDHGREIAHGTADELKAQIGGERIQVTLEPDSDGEAAHRVMARFSKGVVFVEGRVLTAPVSGGAGTLTSALRALDEAGVSVSDVGLRRPTLDDVFLSLTGRVTGDAAGDAAAHELEEVA